MLSTFCGGLLTVIGHAASRGKGFETPGALRLLERLDLKGKIVTVDAIHCQTSTLRYPPLLRFSLNRPVAP